MSKVTWECSCSFMSTRLLPCRHVFYIRKRLNMETIVPTQLLNPQWLLANMEEPHLPVESPLISFAVSAVLPQPKTLGPQPEISRGESFRHEYLRICQFLGMHVFRVAMKVLEKVSTLFKAKQFDKLSVLHGDDGNNEELTSTGDPQRMEAVLLGFINASGKSSVRAVGGAFGGVDGVDGQSVEQSVESMESIERLVETVATGHVSLHTEPLETAEVGFEIPSPIQARGRPKQTRKNNKAKRKQAIVRAIHDSELHDKKLTLSTIMDLLTHQATYATCSDQLKQLKPFERNPKPPTAHRIDKLRIGKPILKPSEISRILPKDLLAQSSKKVTTLQKSTPLWRNQMLLLNFRGLA
ncbi:hypothetical protein PHMEG_00026942 [Phytophthora megakarya]|uniref:SWIM-type domain-containing protein n=1 Tax=Phytophthora megakarya TaxID=4795 RepID=A0A225V8K2_9STRA|nr:hypothetical protein PHMEG_00026942 [Phytophthora megakarya]